MEDNTLTENDYKLLKKLVVITRSILSNYYCLMELENNNENNTEEHHKIVNELQVNFEMEEELYSNITDIYKVRDLLFFLNGYNRGMFENYLFLIFDYETDSLIKSRISSKLEYMMDTMEFVHDEDEEITEESEANEKEFLALNKIQIAIEADIINTIIKLLNDYINNPDYRGIKYSLIEYKYMLIFLFGDIEKETVKNNYEQKDSLNWSHKLIADFYGIKEKLLIDQEEDYSLDLLAEGRELLISLLDSKIEKIENIEDSDYYFDAIVFSIIIRTCLLLINGDLKDSYINLIQDDLNEIKDKNETVVPIINEILNEYKHDVELPSILRLKR